MCSSRNESLCLKPVDKELVPGEKKPGNLAISSFNVSISHRVTGTEHERGSWESGAPVRLVLSRRASKETLFSFITFVYLIGWLVVSVHLCAHALPQCTRGAQSPPPPYHVLSHRNQSGQVSPEPHLGPGRESSVGWCPHYQYISHLMYRFTLENIFQKQQTGEPQTSPTQSSLPHTICQTAMLWRPKTMFQLLLSPPAIKPQSEDLWRTRSSLFFNRRFLWWFWRKQLDGIIWIV